jgi:hypothetical protein
MDDDVTLLFAYFNTTLTRVFSLPVFQSKRPARRGKQRSGGFWEGANISAGAFCLSCDTGDRVDQVPTFENLSRTYPFIVEYVFRAPNAAIVNDAGSAPAEVLESPQVRVIRTSEIENLFLPTTTLVPNLFDVRIAPDRTYDVTADNETVMVSPITFFCTCHNPRPGS